MNKIMKRLLLILGLSLTFVACEKNDEYDELGQLDEIVYTSRSENFSVSSGFVKLSQESWRVDREKGGTITIETDDAAFVEAMSTLVGIDGVGANYNDEIKRFFRRVAPLYIIKYEDIKKIKVYEAFGCKVVRDGYRKFTITVEPNCGSDSDYYYNDIEIAFAKICNSKEYGPISNLGCAHFYIFLR